MNQEKEAAYVVTKVQKWGNSLAVRIPSNIAEQPAIHQGSEMKISVENQKIILAPKKKKPALKELLAKVTPENRHAEIGFGVEGNEFI
ncbi:AbrB/MazE/SpoVT family DNA-binding domain-containing protein [Parageobacillus thermoglucosidasius]|uniref:Transcriptional regulator/antitoxin, MazE n=1 Tax=Geobacillus sp. (strain Y4.1MC1) TaxID=581103 RepID=A0A7U3YIM7_GEOS0|nr:AbrB/MazE/SpoVT family DNA-binding domain-containing protein [Parageobacillus thermoglucosidasius]RDE30477.1 AbrB/MazE/SpoVT family DNA-binding domain-containing protein [Parageobacillus thermoglucosidasius]BDG34059.1 multidrug transporter MatE [Parageobacillus thermoglucosidasius]